LNYQNYYNYVENSNITNNAAKSFDILTTSLSVLLNYLIVQIKLFSNLYLAKFLDILSKLFFPCSVMFHFFNENLLLIVRVYHWTNKSMPYYPIKR